MIELSLLQRKKPNSNVFRAFSLPADATCWKAGEYLSLTGEEASFFTKFEISFFFCFTSFCSRLLEGYHNTRFIAGFLYFCLVSHFFLVLHLFPELLLMGMCLSLIQLLMAMMRSQEVRCTCFIMTAFFYSLLEI